MSNYLKSYYSSSYYDLSFNYFIVRNKQYNTISIFIISFQGGVFQLFSADTWHIDFSNIE